MEMIKLTFLGTGNAVPTKLRNHPAILLSYKNENILIDCGEGTQRQFKYAEISPAKLSKILITHNHGDHILGLPGLIQTLAMTDYNKPLEIYGPKGTNRLLDLFTEITGNQIQLDVKEVTNSIIYENNEIKIEALSMAHGIPTNAYSFIIKDKLRIDKNKLKKLKIPNSPLIKDLQNGKDITINNKKIKAKSLTYLEKGKKITFILDTGLNENAIKIAKNSDLLICESTFSKDEEEKAKDYKHLTSTQAATIAKKSNSKLLVLTHISQRYEHNPKNILKEAKRVFKNTKIVKDLDSLEI